MKGDVSNRRREKHTASSIPDMFQNLIVLSVEPVTISPGTAGLKQSAETGCFQRERTVVRPLDFVDALTSRSCQFFVP